MRKFLLLTFILTFSISCSEDDNITPKENSLKTKTVNYKYYGNVYTLTFDTTDENNKTLLDGKDNEILSEIYLNNEELVTLSLAGDPSIYLFNNMNDYESSALQRVDYNDDLGDGTGSGGGSTGSGTNNSTYESEVFFYKRGGFRTNDGGYKVKPFSNNLNTFIPNFHNLSNNGIYGNLFPQSWYNIGYRDLNDDVSSLKVTNAYLTIYQHANYGGKSRVFNASGASGIIQVSDLNDIVFSCGFSCWNDWNDEITSAIIHK